MRKLDKNAVFNIVIKSILFITASAGCFCLLKLLLGIPVIISVVISVIFALLLVLLFSFLLRYTSFYFGYYSFVSAFLHKDRYGNVFCPCCNKYFSHFHDEQYYSDDKHFNPSMFRKSRQDVICDFCRSAPRHRIIAEWAEQNIEILKRSRILYFAPELSMMLWFRRHNINVKTADLFDRRAELKLDLTALDIPDSSVDIVFCNHVLEHVNDYLQALSELHRVIRKDGMLVISFPIDSGSDHMRQEPTASAEDRIRLYGQHDHLRIFGKDSRDMLENAGFEVSTIDIGNMPENIVPEEGPSDFDSNMIFVCVRK